MGYFDSVYEENKGWTTPEEDNTDNVDAIDKNAKPKYANIGEGTEAPNAEYNVYGSKLEDVQEINRLKDENLELKLIIGEMQLEIYKLHREIDEKD